MRKTFTQLFNEHEGRLVDKWENYLEIYDRHFSRFQGESITLVELGVFQGGSLQLWKKYFGNSVKIIGVDINPSCSKFEDDQVKIMIGDQGNKRFLEQVANAAGKIDIVIDDASHLMHHQITAFKVFFPKIQEKGVYLCEDNHTSYWPEFGGKLRGSNTFIEYSKSLIDELHAWQARENKGPSVTNFTRTAHSVHFYDGIMVVEKRLSNGPAPRLIRGAAELPAETFNWGLRQGIKSRWYRMTSWLR